MKIVLVKGNSCHKAWDVMGNHDHIGVQPCTCTIQGVTFTIPASKIRKDGTYDKHVAARLFLDAMKQRREAEAAAVCA